MATDEEMIRQNKFNGAFKNTLRDYYSYGFRKMADFMSDSSSASENHTVGDDWRRLTNILAGASDIKWSENRREVMFASADSQSMNENPFLRVYRFCRHKPDRMQDFLLLMAVLSDRIGRRPEESAADQEEEDGGNGPAGGGALTTGELVRAISVPTKKRTDPNKTPKNHWKPLLELGLVRAVNKGGRLYWELPAPTLGSILEAGRQADPDFERHFSDALAFFTNYLRFGEAGLFLQDRMGTAASGLFRFKHEYFMQALNDFNLADLLHAMEKKLWCRVCYSRAFGQKGTELLCYPLQIRTSAATGREYLMYYEPFHRSYTAIRMEFIDSIAYYEDDQVRKALPDLAANFAGDIANARQALRLSWGVASTIVTGGNAARPVEPYTVRFRIRWDRDTEGYVPDRLRRERRIGRVSEPVPGERPGEMTAEFTAEVSDPREVLPWIRSFYGRIVSCEGTENVFLLNEVMSHLDGIRAPEPSAMWGIPEDARKELGKGRPAREHEKLFNEFFSVHYHVVADAFMKMSALQDGFAYVKKDAAEVNAPKEITPAKREYYTRLGDRTWKQVVPEIEMLCSDRFTSGCKVKKSKGTMFQMADGRRSRFTASAGDRFYRDVVPLSMFEKRWLLTAVRDPMMDFFLSKEERRAIEDRLCAEGEVEPLPLGEYICCFDKSIRERDHAWEREVMGTLLRAIHEEEGVRVQYQSQSRCIEDIFDPLFVQYSKRNDSFQISVWSRQKQRIMTANLDRFIRCESGGGEHDRQALRDKLADSWKRDSVELAFSNDHGRADRVLNEFSPWDKQCSYDPQAGVYRLKLSYQSGDREELAIRLLGYGDGIRFFDAAAPLYQSVRSRLEKQMVIFQEKVRRPQEGRKDDDDDDEE